jgi:hypothetical protein
MVVQGGNATEPWPHRRPAGSWQPPRRRAPPRPSVACGPQHPCGPGPRLQVPSASAPHSVVSLDGARRGVWWFKNEHTFINTSERVIVGELRAYRRQGAPPRSRGGRGGTRRPAPSSPPRSPRQAPRRLPGPDTANYLCRKARRRTPIQNRYKSPFKTIQNHAHTKHDRLMWNMPREVLDNNLMCKMFSTSLFRLMWKTLSAPRAGPDSPRPRAGA